MTTSTSCVYVTHLVAPKQGSTAAECEDAVAVLPGHPHDHMLREPFAAGVCDGATESALAKDWARLLSRAAAEHAMTLPDTLAGGTAFQQFAASVVARWDPWLADYTLARQAEGRPLKWYEHTKLADGAYATLLTVRVDPESGAHDGDTAPSWRWRAAALGDSCLFHLRDNKLIQTFPVSAVEEFGTTPDLFGSRNRDAALLAERTRFTGGNCHPGDRLLLMTDALAAWLMSAPDQADAVGQLLEYAAPGDLDDFNNWLNGLRDSRQLRNDDVAFVRIDFEGR
ncbi:hypothetical protein ACFWVU_29860 [Streptomyces sp. NPDC058686]|uniref:hypothetical protein n=1 Tax=Streptomyces sp. NPDC058686 TaxID=3346599 RepID=UPI00364B414B